VRVRSVFRQVKRVHGKLITWTTGLWSSESIHENTSEICPPQLRMEDKILDFSLPPAIRDFVFDLHDAVRRARVVEEVQRLYETRLKEITDKYFNQSSWPDAKAISTDVYNDEFFLAIYRYVSSLIYLLLLTWKCRAVKWLPDI